MPIKKTVNLKDKSQTPNTTNFVLIIFISVLGR